MANKVKIKLTTHDGRDYGYLRLTKAAGTDAFDKQIFVGGARRAEATTFVQIPCGQKRSDAHFYQVDGTRLYLDEHARSGVVYPDCPLISLDYSNIQAWRLNASSELEATIDNQGTAVLGEEHNRNQQAIQTRNPYAVFCNRGGYPFTVEIVPQ